MGIIFSNTHTQNGITVEVFIVESGGTVVLKAFISVDGYAYLPHQASCGTVANISGRSELHVRAAIKTVSTAFYHFVAAQSVLVSAQNVAAIIEQALPSMDEMLQILNLLGGEWAD